VFFPAETGNDISEKSHWFLFLKEIQKNMFLLSLQVLENIALVIGLINVTITVSLIVYANIHRKIIGPLRIFTWIAVLSLLQTITAQILSPLVDYVINNTINHSKAIYISIEFLLLLLFLSKIIYNEKQKYLFQNLAILANFAFITSFIYKANFIRENYALVSTVQSFIMLGASFVCFSNLLTTDKIFDLKKSAEFYATTAVFFLFSFSLPFFFFENYFYKIYSKQFAGTIINSINLIIYSIFFLLILIAIRCKVLYQK